jgi:sarcosine oxidase subunit alpha
MVPVRRSPFHSVLEKFGCVFQTSGEWLYSRYFPVADESMSDAVRREVFGVRNAVGCVDMSTLGKVDVKGPDAIRFLSRVYCNDIENIQVGRLRYAIMLREDGMVFDDGTVSCLAENHYLITMTTANSASVWRWLNRLLQVHWPELDVQLTLVSDHYASLAIAGPNARALLGDMSPDFECNKGDFPFASVRTGWLDEKVSCRVFSLSYSGELSFEINVPARHAHWLYQRVIELGADYGVTPYGLEALDVLRIEKGHISVGAEIDGRTTPQDLGLANMVSTHKDFIGASLLQRPALKDTNRLHLVGLVPVDDTRDIPTGAQLVDRKWRAGDVMNSIGRMTAVINSPTLGCSIGLALLERGHHRTRDTLWAASPIENRSTEVRVVDRCFYDPGGTRLRD